MNIPFDRLDDEFSDAEESRDENIATLVNTLVDTLVRTADTPVDDENPVGPDRGLPFASKEEIEGRIMSICAEPRGILAIAASLGFREKKSVRRYLIPLIDQGRIVMTIPDKPTSRFQKYVTIK